MKVGLILGGGGEVGIAWEIGVLAALEKEAGFEAQAATAGQDLGVTSVAARCGGRRDAVDASANADAAVAEEERPDTYLSGYCTWTAYDGGDKPVPPRCIRPCQMDDWCFRCDAGKPGD